ncbi:MULTISPECIES: hypothetical protein [Mesorhizobium]|uniref:hypothetical protein n=1 Tax=Mesorhizobium TaxID=68287 RepID=UPI00035F6175|nr:MULTISPECIES: hypothetical protein [Mesorhizobium]OBP96893.1 hypothetical protein BAE38_26725 [Mesorhizobium loti]OBQ73470.1 hypothetical protein A9K72_30625 [Mesorhizobium loti]QKC73356.1 hypothetical protein EB815_32810 [Mesorhizobium loti]
MRKLILQLKQFLRGQPTPEAIENERHDVSVGPDRSDRTDACRGDSQSLAREGDHRPYGDKACTNSPVTEAATNRTFLGKTITCSADSANGSKDYLTAGVDSRFQDPTNDFDPRLGWRPHVIALVDIERNSFIFQTVGYYRDGSNANSVDNAGALPGYPANWFYTGKSSLH